LAGAFFVALPPAAAFVAFVGFVAFVAVVFFLAELGVGMGWPLPLAGAVESPWRRLAEPRHG
jgi:hypothetical protein